MRAVAILVSAVSGQRALIEYVEMAGDAAVKLAVFCVDTAIDQCNALARTGDASIMRYMGKTELVAAGKQVFSAQRE